MSHRRQSLQIGDLFPREIDVENSLKTLKIYQKYEGDVNCVVWDAALVLAKYLETICYEKPEFMSNLKILELGSGVGLVGLTAATLGAQVTLTDLPETLPLLRLNVNENKTQFSSVGGYAVAEPLIWGDKTSDLLKEQYDLVLLADCVYYKEAVESLIDTLRWLCLFPSKSPIIYITQEMRDSETQKTLWKDFLEKMSKQFIIEQISEEQQHVNFRSSDIILLKCLPKGVDSN